MQALVDVEMDQTELIKKHHIRIDVLFTHKHKRNQLNGLFTILRLFHTGSLIKPLLPKPLNEQHYLIWMLYKNCLKYAAR